MCTGLHDESGPAVFISVANVTPPQALGPKAIHVYFLTVGIRSVTWVLPSENQSVGRAVLLSGESRGEFASLFFWVVERTQFLMAVGLSPLFSCWL